MASYSSLCDVTSCQRKALLKMQFKKFKRKTDPLVFGSAYHLSLEKDLSSGIEAYLDGARDNELDVGRNIELLTEMNLRANRFFLKHGIVITEHEVNFDIPIPGLKEHFIGFVDGICEYGGKTWLIEFKTARSIDVQHVPIDSQITSYIWACKKLGICDPEGVLYVVNQKSFEKQPVVLRNGDLSVAKTQGCSYDAYAGEALRIYGDNIPPRVEKFMQWLKENERPKLVMVATKRTDEELENFERTLVDNIKLQETLRDRYEEKGLCKALQETPCFPNKMCFQFCDYKNECLTLMTEKGFTDDDLGEEFVQEVEK